MSHDRRQFARIPFSAQARLQLPDGAFDVKILDLSLKGALVEPAAGIFATIGGDGSLELPLDGSAAAIRMEITVVHRQGGYLGLACREIDLDSITHLRRLVELNIGDASVLNRDLAALAHSGI